MSVPRGKRVKLPRDEHLAPWYSRARSGKKSPAKLGSPKRDTRPEGFTTCEGFRMRGYVADAYSEAMLEVRRAIVGDAPIDVSIVRTMQGPFTGDDDPHKLGIALDIRIDGMQKVYSAVPGYDDWKPIIRKVTNIFRRKGFVARNMYDISRNIQQLNQGKEGYLEMTYKGVPPPIETYWGI